MIGGMDNPELLSDLALLPASAQSESPVGPTQGSQTSAFKRQSPNVVRRQALIA
jgi:hypothetical protein